MSFVFHKQVSLLVVNGGKISAFMHSSLLKFFFFVLINTTQQSVVAQLLAFIRGTAGRFISGC